MFSDFSKVLQGMAKSNNIQFEQQQYLSVVNSQVCMMEIQEMALKLDIKMSTSQELLDKAVTKTQSKILQSNNKKLQENKKNDTTIIIPVPKSIGPTESQISMTQASTLTYSTLNQTQQEPSVQ